MGTLCVRADSGVAMGTGHIMRCLALAQAWQDRGGDVLFAMAEREPSVEARLRAEEVRVVPIEAEGGSSKDVMETIAVARKYGADWVVVDGYQFGAKYQEDLKRGGLKILFVDDSRHARDYAADIVLNQNTYASAEIYSAPRAHTRFLLGPRYALLRREFRGQRDVSRRIPAVARKVLVTMGGSDPENLTLRAIEALRLVDIDELEAAVVIGGINPHAGSLRAAAGKSGKNIRLLSDISNVSEWMNWAEVAVSAAGSTCWEMCFLGLPAVLVDFAPNQTPVAEDLNRLGAAMHFGGATSVVPKAMADALQELMRSPERRATISQKASELVDGRGAERAGAAIYAWRLQVRPVQQSDCRQLWEWANDPFTRRVSFSPDTICWEDHVRWFTHKLMDKNAMLYLAVDDAQSPVGCIRYEIEGERAIVSINVAVQFRGKGYGAVMLAMANERLFQNTPVHVIDAFVKMENTASIRLFVAAGFSRQSDKTVASQEAACFTFEKSGRSNG
jgi:UDP-2,4-diacetamido-2,4,6-trideoxy-beta-L-altropyranose hydrolase